MNDPNGLLFYKGKYHLFFQHNPQANVWGNMSWGHAVSTDLYNWQELPVAIACTETSGIFSGSVVVDHNNTSGFGTTENPPIVAIYTEHQNDESNQSQCLAYSVDEGLTFTKYEGNPVLDINLPNFRDPKVNWIDGQWIMTLALPQEFKITFYSSPNLKEWTHLSDFGPAAEVGGIWECPDLFQIGDKWVLIVSLNPGGFQIGSGTQYFVGQWNGKEFIADDVQTRWIDFGRDNYAGVTFSNTGDKRIFLGWMSNWDYAAKLDSQVWRGSMTSPRELQIIEVANELFLSALPIAELKTAHDYNFAISHDEDSEITISDGDEKVVIHFNSATKTISVDRSNAWFSQFEEKIQTTSPITLENFTIRLLLDHGSLELFVPEAAVALTCLHTLPASSTVLQKTAKR